jgi:hypothetical protein
VSHSRVRSLYSRVRCVVPLRYRRPADESHLQRAVTSAAYSHICSVQSHRQRTVTSAAYSHVGSVQSHRQRTVTSAAYSHIGSVQSHRQRTVTSAAYSHIGSVQSRRQRTVTSAAYSHVGSVQSHRQHAVAALIRCQRTYTGTEAYVHWYESGAHCSWFRAWPCSPHSRGAGARGGTPPPAAPRGARAPAATPPWTRRPARALRPPAPARRRD